MDERNLDYKQLHKQKDTTNRLLIGGVLVYD
jgi:hypothetical protein